MKVGILIIGDEILLGRVTDTNSGAIARAVDKIGARVVSIVTVGDSAEAIRGGVNELIERCDVVFTTGGLGPTKDDITKKVLTEIFGGETVRDPRVTDNILRIFEKRNLKVNTLTLDQALVPSSAVIIQNRFGTAPVMVFEKAGCTLISLPGVPFELEGMLPETIGYLWNRHRSGMQINHVTRILTGISESALAQRLDDFENALPDNYKLAYLPDSPIMKLRLDCYGDSRDLERLTLQLDGILDSTDGIFVLGKEDKTVGEIIVDTLRDKAMTLSTAESCTGGNIARIVTAVPGASAIFLGGVVSYSNEVKADILGVGRETLRTYGAVSRQVVVQMAEGSCRAMSTDCAVATSGIAGPGGATPEKPVGTVWIAVKTPKGLVTECYHFPGNRQRVIERATVTALIMLLKNL